MTEAGETIEETEKRLVSVAVTREGDRVSVTETIYFEGMDYVTKYSSWNRGSMSVLCENLSTEHDLPKPKYASDPDPISKTIIVGDGTLVYGGATSYGEFGKLYRNNHVSFRISRSKNDRTCYLGLNDTNNTKLSDAWQKLRNQIEILPENKNRFDIHSEHLFHELFLDITVPADEFDRILSHASSRFDQQFVIECIFEANSGVFSEYDHFKIPGPWDHELHEEFRDSNPEASSFSFHFYQVLKGTKSRFFHKKEISHFPILKNIIGSRKFHKKLEVFSEKMKGYLAFSVIAVLWIAGSFYISDTAIDFVKSLFNR